MKGAGIVEQLPHLGWSAKLLGISSATDKDRTGCYIRFVVTFMNFDDPDGMSLHGEWIEFSGDGGLNGIQRILDGRTLGVVYGETLNEFTLVVDADKDVAAGGIGEGAHFLTEFPYLGRNALLEFNVLALSLGNQIQCFLFVNHIVRSLLAKILISFGISVEKRR